MSPVKRRRVTFADEPSVVTYTPATDQPDTALETPDGTSEPEDAAIQHSERSQRQHELQNMQGIEDTSILEDLAEAEEEYDRPEQAFNEAGIAFEPFHLKKEREEGYFDTDGNYIQYKLDEVKDAWLDSLAEGSAVASAGTSDTLGQHSKQSAAPAQVIELDADELLTCKRRLLDLLDHHETVLTALRRLGGRLDAVRDGADGMPWKRRKSSGQNSKPAIDSAATNTAATMGTPPASRTGRTVPIENREAFDRLTEYSSLLLQHGDYNIHSTSREKIVIDIDAAEAAQLQAVMGVLSTACPSSHNQSAQPNSSYDNTAEVNGATETEAPSTSHMQVDGTEEREETDAPSVAQLATSGNTEAAAAAAVNAQPVPADPDEDIFGAAAQDTVDSAQADQTAQNVGAASSSRLEGGSDSDQQAAQPRSIQHAANATNSSSQELGKGFLYDESSGTWYNSELGYYYDASQGLYGDASSGHWYAYKDGTYQLVC